MNNSLNDAVFIVQKQIEAYNNHDLEAFVDFYHPNAEIFRLPSGEKILNGHDAIRSRYAKVLATSGLHVVIESRLSVGDLVVDSERVFTNVSTEISQEAVVMYEVQEGLIQRVWIFNLS